MAIRNTPHWKYVADNPSAKHQDFSAFFNLDKNFGKVKFYRIKRAFEQNPALINECAEQGLDFDNVSHYWHKSKNISTFVKVDNSLKAEDIIQMIDEVIEARKIPKIKPTKLKPTDKVLNVILSDMHVGLEPNPQGRSLFQFKYDKEEFNYRLEQVLQAVFKEYNTHGTFQSVVLYDLGDGLDGWNAETTRGGHKLDQNMSNIEAFKTYVSGKLNLIEMIINSGVTNKVIVRSVSKCNHSGDFGYIANETIRMLLHRVYGVSVVQFYILERFMEHFYHGNHCFIITHGKDDKSMKQGLPLNLNDKTINYINSYIKHYKIDAKYIHVYKGDLHQVSFHKTRDFDYRNFPSFAPPSNWAQHNFTLGVSGYSTEIIGLHDSEVTHSDYFFNFEEQ